MNRKILMLGSALTFAVLVGNCPAQELPEGYWSLEQATEVLSKTRTVVLDPDISSLSEAEKSVADKLIQVGEIFNRIYVNSLHPQALESFQRLSGLHSGEEHTAALLDIYYRSAGPITTTLDNKRVAFLPVDPEVPGKNVYPTALTNAQMDPFLEARPELAAGLLNVRTVVRASNKENIQLDLLTLDRFPVLDDMHHGLRNRLETLSAGKDDAPWYALPYSVRWAPEMMQAYKLLLSAANDIKAEDPDFAAYLSLRARDIISDDYEGGELCFPNQDVKIKLEAGDAIVFPPYRTHPHYTNALNGTFRYTINTWLCQ